MAEQYKETEKYLNKFGKEVVKEIKTRAPKASNDLAKSVRYEVNGKDLTLTYYMNEYGKYMDKGVSGHGKLKGLKGLDKDGNKKSVVKAQFDPYDKRVHKFGSKMPPNTSEFKETKHTKGS